MRADYGGSRIQQRALHHSHNFAQIDKNKPIAIFSGDKDPVGGNGKLVKKLYEQYKNLGVKGRFLTASKPSSTLISPAL